MSFWVVRAGKHGENEEYALEHNVVAIGWEDVGDIGKIKDRDELQRLISETYPEETISTTRVWTGELWALKDRIQNDDWVALPLKSRAAIAVGRIAGPYKFVPDGPPDPKHQRRVRWIRTDLSRAEVDQDLLYSLGSILTVFRVRRNNAEDRLVSLVEGQRSARLESAKADIENSDQDAASIDVEQFAADKIVNYISRKFRGHDLARLVAGVLTAEGYRVLLSPPGADGGVDIIAGVGPMGFDRPRLAVQVKSSDSPADVSVVRELQGVMPRFGADQGLVVSWGGFKDSVLREARQLFFAIRLWDAGDLVGAIQRNYQNLTPELQAELPLKQLWALVID
jgi:restriction system protein